MQKIIFQISGGIGKHVAATAVIKAIKKQYPDCYLIVVSGYSIVFRNNPYVDQNVTFNEQIGFFERFIDRSEPKPIFLTQEPYHDSDFLNRINGHLIKIWCEVNREKINYNGELPEIFLTDNEKERFFQLFNAGNGKKNLVMQTNGGAPPQDPTKANPHPYSWARDIPIATAAKVVEEFKEEYNIFQIRRRDQFQLPHIIPVTDMDFRAIAYLISISDKRLFMDSFAQHTAAALRKPAVVLWIANIPEQFGYTMHNNIIANPGNLKPDLRNSVYQQYDITGLDVQCPYNSQNDVISADTLIAALKGTLKAEPAKNGVAKPVAEKV
jgi:hypothetical protein